MDNETSHNPEPAQEIPLVDAEKIDQNQTDQQKRDARIQQIDQELAEFSVKAQTEDEINAVQSERDKEYQNKILELETGLGQPLSEETKTNIHQNMVDNVIEAAKKENEHFNELLQQRASLQTMELFGENGIDVENVSEAEDLISSMESLGAKIGDDSRARLVEILSSFQILHVNRRELVKLLGVDEKDNELIRKLYQPFNEKYGKLLRGWLIKENKRVFSGSELNLTEHQEIQVDGETIDMAELNDPEISELGIEKIKQIIDDIIKDKESAAGQGMFWNVLVPKEISYVLKTERKLQDKNQEKYSRESLLQYPIIRDSIGREFLPRQAVLQAKDSERFHVLQEKIPLQKMTSIRNKNIDAIIAGEYGQEIVNSLKEEKNKEKLKSFIYGVERLYQEHKLMIDTVGDNLFFNVSENGDLDIKLVDYGAFKHHWKEPSNNIKETLVFLEKLKNLL